MYAYNNIVKFFTAFLFFSILFSKSNDDVLKSDLDSLNTLTKKSPERAIRFARELLKKLEPSSESNFEYKINNTLGEIFLDLQMHGQAMSHFMESKLIRERLGKPNAPWNSLNIGNVYYQQGKYIEARRFYNEALDKFNNFKHNKDNRVSGRKVALSNLGRIEVKIKNYDKALNYFKEALDVSRKSPRFLAYKKSLEKNSIVYENSARGVAYQHYLISNLYKIWEQYDFAVEENQKADRILKDIIDKSENSRVLKSAKKIMGNNLSLLAEINTKLGKFEEALIQSREATQLLKDWPYSFADHMEVESEYYSVQGELYLALTSLDRGLKVCDIEGLDIRKISLLENKLNLLKVNKLERSALDISEEINRLTVKVQEERMASLFDGLEHKNKIMLRKEQLSKAKEKQVIISSLLGALLILMGIAALNLRNKKRFIDQRSRLVKRKKQLVDQALKSKENDLARMSAYIVSKNDLLNSIVSDLEYHTSLIENKKDRRLMTPLKKKISEKIDESADWDQFQIQFSLAYPDFIEKLTVKYSDLRSGDIKLCCYLKMNMNTKDIAQITGLSVRAIENKRYRLRKKLNLKTDISLEAFLHSSNNIISGNISGNGVA
ncbi:MAG: transcriptional regulator [Candidatus Neomarinimicrobiota bacterium]